MALWELDAHSPVYDKRSLRFAVMGASAGDTIRLAPGTYLLDDMNPTEAKHHLSINRNLTIEAAIPNTVELFGRMKLDQNTTDGVFFFVRNQDAGFSFCLKDIAVNMGNTADTVNDGSQDCMKIQASKPGNGKTEVFLINCRFSNASGGMSVETNTVGQGNSDDDLHVVVRNCIIEDMFDDRRADGVREPHTSAQGVFHNGGSLYMMKSIIRRIGWVPGSSKYERSNKSHGLYASNGWRKIAGCTAIDCSHTGFGYRAGETMSEGNAAIRCAVGFEAGHRETPWHAVVSSTHDIVADGAALKQTLASGEKSNIVTGGFSVYDPKQLSLRRFTAWNAYGESEGDWSGLHIGSVNDRNGGKAQSELDIDIESIDVSQWGGRPFRVSAWSDNHPGLQKLIAKYGTGRG